MASSPTGLQTRIDAFNKKVALKTALIDLKAEQIKQDLLKRTPIKQTKLNASSLLDNPVDKDFGTIWKFNAAKGYSDADTVAAVSPYTQFYGKTVDGVKDRTVTEPVRLGQSGASIDTYETRKLDDAGNVLPYPENKKRYHQIHYAQQHNLPSYTMVSDDMLFDAAEEQTQNLLKQLYKGVTWNDYGEPLADGSIVPYPENIQKKLDILKADLKIATQKESEKTKIKEDRVPIPDDLKMYSKTLQFVPEWFPDPQDLAAKTINAFDRLKDNVVEDFAAKSTDEIKKEIATLEIATNARREVDPNVLTGDIGIDIQVNGVGIYDRKLGVLINPTTGDNINTKVNTPADNPAYMSKYNKEFVDKLTQNVRLATLREYGTDGYGFWKQIGIGLEGGIDTLQALGFSGAAYLVELLPNEIRSKFGKVPIKLPDISKMFGINSRLEWNTPEAYGTAWLMRYQEKLEDARRVGGRMPIIEEIDWMNPKQVLSKVGDAFGEGLPSISFMIGSGGVGGVAAKTLVGGVAKKAATNAAKKLALRRIQVIGSRVGVGSSAVGLQTSAIWGDVATGEDADKSWRARGLTLAGGIASGSLEMLFPMTFFRKAGMPLKTTNGIKKKFSARLATLGATIAKESAAGGITEGTTEGLQFIIEEITQEYIKSGELPDFASEEFKSGFWNSVFAGFVPGGGIRMASSTVSGLNEAITRNSTEVKKAVQQARNEAGEVENKEVAGKEDFESQKILADEVKGVEELAPTLDIDLNKEYKKKSNLDKGIELSDTLNDLEIAQKELPVAERNKELLSTIEKARESLNIALNNVNTGDSFVKSSTEVTVIQNNKDKQIKRLKTRYASLIASVKDKKLSKKFDKAWKQKKIKSLEKDLKDKILIQENKATKALEPILKKAKKGRIAGTKVLEEKIRANVKQINAITKKLKDPKLSKKQRKRLIYKRNALAAVIDGMSRDGEGRLDTLTKGTVENVNNIVNSEWFENRKVSSRTRAETKEKIKTATEAFKEYTKEKNKKKSDRESLQKLKNNAIKLYNELLDIIPQLRKDLEETTDRALKARLVIDLEKFNKLKAKLEKEFADDQIKNEETKKEEQKAKPKQAILNSLDIDSINEGLTKEEEEILGSLTPKEKANKESRKKAATAAKKIKRLIRSSTGNIKKSLTVVHNEIIKGKKGHFLGIETFLEQTKRRQLNKSKLNHFIVGLVNKNKAFTEAFALYNKTGETVYIHKNTNEIFENLNKVPKKDRGKKALNKNYWYVNKRSKRLLTLMQDEVNYVQEVKTLILDIQSNLEKIDDDAKIKIKEDIDNTEADKILRQNVETTGTLEDVVPPTEEGKETVEETTTEEKVEEKAEEEVKEKVEEETTKPEKTETKKEKRTRERAKLNDLEKELKTKNNNLKAELDALNKLEKKKGSLTRRNEIKAIKNQIRINNRRLKLEVQNKRDARDVAENNHWLNKFKDTFNKLKDSDIKIRELFQIKDLSRRSIFSLSDSKNLVTIRKDGTVDTSGITSKLIELGVTDKAYIKSIASNFVKFRTIFYKNINEGLDKDELRDGSYTVRESKLFLDKDGNMPDDVLFAMMLTLLHWSAINQKASETRPLFTIASLVFDDPKQIGRLDREQITTFIDTGIFVKDASKEIGLEILDMLNIKIKEPTIQSIYLRLKNIVNKDFDQPISYRSNLKPRLATALGLLTLQTARYMNAQGRVKQGDPKEGLIEVVRGEYDIELFDNPNLIFTEEQQKKKTIDWNSVQIEDDPELELYKDNAENLKLIKGTESFIRDTYEVAVEDTQEEVDNSFFKLNKKIKEVILKLQSVRWEGKRFELKLFRALNQEASDMLLDIKDLDKTHDESKDSVEASNNEKLRDKDHVFNYMDSGDNPGFYFRYKAQIQHRLRIVSNTINGQRSKVHRFLFNPTGSETTVTTDSHKAIFKLAVIQSFGYNITTLKEGLATFERIRSNESIKKIVKELQKTELNEELFNELIIEVMKEQDLVSGVSTHLLEGLHALAQYHTKTYRPKKTFVTAIGIETDGTTNGYAISLLQFLDGDISNPQDLKEALARVGVYVGTKESKDTYERFVASGKDDVYQSFSRQIATAIFGTTSKFNEKEQNIITALHGELLKDGVLTKFARDLAKIPVMVSNYGGSLYKIIQNVIGEVVPNLYDNLADIQTRYDAGNDVDKVEIRNELKVIQDAINNIPKIKKVDLLSRLDKTGSTTDKDGIVTQNNLYGFIFTSSRKRSIGQIERIENFFEDVYAGEDGIFKNALEDLLEPTMEARETLVKVVEAEYFVFRIAYDKAIGDLGLGAVDIDIKMRIAADLADELMPRATVPWADAENQLLQLIKFTDSKDNRVEVKTKPFLNQKYRKKFRNWIKSGKAISDVRIGANTTTSEFESPGVGSAVNQTQNMDSTVIGDLLDQKQQVLPLFDAVISSITTVQENVDIYNDSFLTRNLEHVFLEETLAQFKTILANAKKYKITKSEINELLQTESHRAKQIIKEMKEGDDSNAAEFDSMTINELEKALKNKIKSRKDNLITLLDVYGNADNLDLKALKKLDNKNLNDLIIRSWRVSQMPLPESIKDPSLEPIEVEETGVGSETDAKQSEIAKDQGDPGNANTNIDEGQAAIDAIEREQREAFEAEELAEIIESNKANVEEDKKADDARKGRQTLYQQADEAIKKIENELKPFSESLNDDEFVGIDIDNTIRSLANVRSTDFSDPLENVDDDGEPLTDGFEGIEHIITFNINQIVEDYNKGMLYIQGKGVGLDENLELISKQKEIVFSQIDIEDFKKHIEETGGIAAYINFIYQHEQGHIKLKHDVSGLDPLSLEAINIEIEANEYAFDQIKFVRDMFDNWTMTQKELNDFLLKSQNKYDELTFEEKFESLGDKNKEMFESLLTSYREIITIQNKVYAELNKEEREILADAERRLTVLNTELDNLIDEEFFDNMFSLQNSVEKDLKRIYRTNSLRGNLQSIFETLGEASIDSYRNTDDKNTQQLHLQRVLDEIISKAGSELDRTQLTLNRSNVKSDGSANINQTSINVNINRFKPLSYSEQTSQEVYAHEIVHILTRFAIKNDSQFKRRLEELRDQVIAEIERTEVRPYEIFLNKDEQGNIIFRTSKKAEIDAAKQQYDYVFGNKVPAKYKLDEFLAYALTNKYIVAKTANMASEKIPLWSKNENRRISEKIIEFFAELLNRVTNTLSRKQKPLTVQQEIFELTRDIVDVNQSKRASLAKSIGINIVAKGINRGNDEGAKLLQYAWSQGSRLVTDTWIKMVDKATRDGKINNFLAKVLYDTKLVAALGSSYKDYVDTHPDVQKKLNSIYKNIKPSFLKNASSLWINGFGGESLDFIRLLYQSHKDIDADRKAFKENSKKNLRKLFLTFDDLTTSQKESITRVMLKTDLSSLLVNKAFTQDEILELIRDEKKLNKEIKKYEGPKKLNIRNNNYYRIQISQLANYMMTGDTYAYEQKLNASNIYKTGIVRHRAYKKTDREQEIKDIDTYITLLALKSPELKYAKEDVNLVMQNELAQEESTKSENAFIGLLNVHIAFKEDSRNNLFLDREGKPSDALMAKGYIATVTDDDAKVTVEKSDPESKAKMLKDGYTFISNVENFTKEPYGMYVIYNYPTEPRTKGIASLKSNRFMGTDIREIFSRNPEKSGFIMAELSKVKRKQQKLARKGKLSKIPTMIPLMDEDINVNTFRYTLSHALSEQHLKQDLRFDEVLSTMESHKVDKINSKQINRDTVELLYKHGKENYSDKPNKFVNILDNIYEDEYFRPLPKDMKEDVLYHARVNKETGKEEFWVERKLLDMVFGYQNPSIANISVLETSDKYQRYSKVSEKFWKEWIGIAKVNIVVRTPIVPAINFTSNFITSWMYGVPLPYIIKYWREAAIELSDYRANAEKLKDLDFRIKANPELANKVAIKNRRAILVADMNQNKVAPFVTQGLFNSITEDINEDEFTYRNKLFTKLKRTKGGKLIKGRALDIANMAYLGEKTKIFKESTHFLQISDFIARYALYKYQTEVAGKSADQAYKTMVETFVNYDQPLNRYLAYTNDIGLIMFVKYWVRIQRAGLNLIKEKPLNAALLFVGNGFFDLDIETILESSIFTGNILPTYGGIENNFEQVITPPGLEILMGRGF